MAFESVESLFLLERHNALGASCQQRPLGTVNVALRTERDGVKAEESPIMLRTLFGCANGTGAEAISCPLQTKHFLETDLTFFAGRILTWREVMVSTVRA